MICCIQKPLCVRATQKMKGGLVGAVGWEWGGGVKSCNNRVVIRYNGTYNGTYFFLLSCVSSGHGHVDEAMNLKK